jgi:hypothetical protein
MGVEVGTVESRDETDDLLGGKAASADDHVVVP